MRILAVDPGFERVGIAVVETASRERMHLLAYSECFRTPKEQPFPERLAAIGKEIERVIGAYAPEILAIEALYFNTNKKTALRVAEARGVIIREAERGGLKVSEYTPPQVKIALTGYGRASKAQVAAMVEQLIRIPEKKARLDDEFDAIAIGLTHAAHNQRG